MLLFYPTKKFPIIFVVVICYYVVVCLFVVILILLFIIQPGCQSDRSGGDSRRRNP